MVELLLLVTAFRSQGRIWKWMQINRFDKILSSTVTPVTTGSRSFAARYCSDVRSKKRETVSLLPSRSTLGYETPLGLALHRTVPNNDLIVNFTWSQKSEAEGRGMNKKEMKDKEEEGVAESAALKGTKALATQVGGHRCGKQGNKPSMLDRGNGLVLKALQDPPRGTRELSLYQTIFAPSCQDKHLLELRHFLPLYYGTEAIGDETFLVMDNIAHSFNKPNVLDLKMGRVTYDPEATPKKIEQEETKFPPLKQLGFQMIGMMIHDQSSGCAKHFPKKHCRSFTAETILTDGLGMFFGLNNGGLRKDVLNVLLTKLRRIEQWFLVQHVFAFYASSLLIVYNSLDQDPDAVASNPDKSSTNPSISSIDQDPASSSAPGVDVETVSVNGRDSSDKNGLAADSRQTKKSEPQSSILSKQGAGQKRGLRDEDRSVAEVVSHCKHSKMSQEELSPSESERRGEAETKQNQMGPSLGKQVKRAPSETQQIPTGASGEEKSVSSVEGNGNTPETVDIACSYSKGTREWEELRTHQRGPPLVDVRMIDFAHAFPASGRDDNYLFGLQKLISFLEQLLKM